ncbi:MAG TPA: TIGR03618 family F420-dependent PPOX class oxidoreductase [Miltoncostaea sp.]|nr:TIGR03618 family F420-dependent PPOX class oxidoreductase [Miltoncostaea sp.]
MSGIPDDVRELFDARNFAHLATVGPKGPTSVPIWVAVEGDRIVFFTQRGSRKAVNIGRDARVALSVTDRGDPYRQADVRGRVVERLEREAALAAMDRISQKYIGGPFPMRDPDTTVAFVVEVDRARHVKLPFSQEG